MEKKRKRGGERKRRRKRNRKETEINRRIGRIQFQLTCSGSGTVHRTGLFP